MKPIKYIKEKGWVVALSGMLLIAASSCDDYLDRSPLSSITPEEYLWDESQLSSYAITRYSTILPSHNEKYGYGIFGIDGNTDNMGAVTMDNKYSPGLLRVPNTGGEWNFEKIYQLNYFLKTVLPRLNTGQITATDNIKHYVGEIYFLRACEYFKRLQAVGDFPIVKDNLPDNLAILTAASKRMPRSEVARFIIADLDSATVLLKDASPDGKKNRISKACAQLMISRVGLFEGTWLKYFKGTAFVPNGEGWPGKTKEYNANYQFKSGSIDNEIQYFLGRSMDAAKIIAKSAALTNNTGIVECPGNENPYYTMFYAVDMSTYPEILMWRAYDKGLGLTHSVPVFAQHNNNGAGLTRSMTESFLMANGLPIYASGSGYEGDDYIADVRKDRDGRLNLFLKEPGQKNVLTNVNLGTHKTAIEPIPEILKSASTKYTTGYAIRKGSPYDGAQCDNGGGYTGCAIFRTAEAYLNYIEACYEKTGSLDGDARSFWQTIRTRAKVDPNFDKTIAATQMSKETGDWGAYSANKLVDPTLYNIRRERRNELMAEGFRYMDLLRWRAMDQMINTAYHMEGFKLWGPMKDWYLAKDLIYGANNTKSNVSDPALSDYLRPYEITNKATSYVGCKWTMAHYLSPIATQNFKITSVGSDDYSASPIYQNPGWPIQAGAAPIGFQ